MSYNVFLLIFNYLENKEDLILIKIMYYFFNKEIVDKWYHLAYQNKEINHDFNFIDFKGNINQFIETLKDGKQANDYADCFSQIFSEPFFSNRLMSIDETGYLNLMSAFNKFKEYQEELSLPTFMTLFQQHYHVHNNEESYIDAITIQSINKMVNSTLSFKYLYILGCKEGDFPGNRKDNGLIFDKDREQIKKNNPTYRLHRERMKDQYHTIYKLLNIADKIFLSYPTGSISGDENLESLLFTDLMRMCKQMIQPLSSNRNKLATIKKYQKDYFIEQTLKDLKEINTDVFLRQKEIINHYRENKNNPYPLEKEIVQKLLSKEKGLYTSTSQLETYNGCPYRHYLSYILNIRKIKNNVLELSDLGTVQHDLLEKLAPLYKSNEVTKDDEVLIKLMDHYHLNYHPDHLNDNVFTLVKAVLLELIEENPFIKDKVEKDKDSESTLNRIIHSTVNNLCILIYQASKSQFEIYKSEGWVSKPINTRITLTGKVDRIDECEDYIKVLDYKSSNKSIDLGLAIQGFNIQMLVYLDLLSTSLNKRKAGVMYFNLSNRVLKAKDKMILKKESFHDLAKEYRSDGYLVHDDRHTVVSSIDKDYFEGSSDVFKMRYVKSKEIMDGKLLSCDEFNLLNEMINERIDIMVDEIFHQGNISITPASSELPAIRMKVNPCRYCDFHDVCQRDVFYNEDRNIIDYKKEEVLKQLGKDECNHE